MSQELISIGKNLQALDKPFKALMKKYPKLTADVDKALTRYESSNRSLSALYDLNDTLDKKAYLLRDLREQFEEIYAVATENCDLAKAVVVEAWDIEGKRQKQLLEDFAKDFIPTLEGLRINIDNIETKLNVFREHSEDGNITS